ncbi:hypothetical protein IKE98_02040 [Candidatus Saccharibacteria bacterium]|nr:hypothetical protein [Candidatus Saccharibacteria bacterium]
MVKLSEKDDVERYLREYIGELNKRTQEDRGVLGPDTIVTSIRLMRVLSAYNALELRMNTILNHYYVKPEHSRNIDEFFWSQRSMFSEKVDAIKYICKASGLNDEILSWGCFQCCSRIRNIFAHSQYLLNEDHSSPLRITLMGKKKKFEDMEELSEKFYKNDEDANYILDLVSEYIGLPRIK